MSLHAVSLKRWKGAPPSRRYLPETCSKETPSGARRGLKLLRFVSAPARATGSIVVHASRFMPSGNSATMASSKHVPRTPPSPLPTCEPGLTNNRDPLLSSSAFFFLLADLDWRRERGRPR